MHSFFYFCPMIRRSGLFLFYILWLHTGHLQAQFQEQSINIGNIGVNVTNAGTIGRPNVRNDPQGAPSMANGTRYCNQITPLETSGQRKFPRGEARLNHKIVQNAHHHH